MFTGKTTKEPSQIIIGIHCVAPFAVPAISQKQANYYESQEVNPDLSDSRTDYYYTCVSWIKWPEVDASGFFYALLNIYCNLNLLVNALLRLPCGSIDLRFTFTGIQWQA